jgi:hypothetical protein
VTGQTILLIHSNIDRDGTARSRPIETCHLVGQPAPARPGLRADEVPQGSAALHPAIPAADIAIGLASLPRSCCRQPPPGRGRTLTRTSVPCSSIAPSGRRRPTSPWCRSENAFPRAVARRIPWKSEEQEAVGAIHPRYLGAVLDTGHLYARGLPASCLRDPAVVSRSFVR